MAEFRQRHLKEFKKLFGQVARSAAEAGLVKLGRVAVDGCKIKANASKHKAMSYSRMLEEEKRLEGEIAELLDRAQQVDKAEDELYGEENQGDELPEELRRRERSAEKDRGGKAASGATAGRGGSEARPQARRRSQEPARRTPLQAGVWSSRGEGPRQLYRSGKSNHEELWGIRTMLQHASRCG